jgi:DNA helicase-2/ATP-dependent DNA helicase PcrA
MKNYLKELNEEQRDAVLHEKGPALILAGAGSGKTRVVTYRIIRLLNECGVDPFRVLAVTFTNKAAGEMRERVSRLAGGRAQELFIGTFHSFCLRILKAHGEKLGYKPGFTLFDEADQESLVKECLWDLKWDEKQVHPRAVHAFISAAKNELKGPSEYAEAAAGFFMERVAKVYPLYQEKLRQNNAMDFDDLLFNAVALFEQEPKALVSYQARFEYVLVDEYQDINTAQYRLVRHLAAPEDNLCVVGDPDQSIYSWRGADIRNIMDFERDFKGARVYKLQQNYRSTQSVIRAAQAVIRNNRERKEKDLFAVREEGDPVTYYQAQDDKDEAEYVVRTLTHSLTQLGKPYKAGVVLYRTNAQSRVLEDAFRRHRVPYVIIGGLKFYERREVKDLLAYLKVLVNPRDSVSLRRIINVPIRGIGSGTVEKLEGRAKREERSLLEAAREAVASGALPPKTNQAVSAFLALMDGLLALKDRLKPSEFLKEILSRSGYLSDLEGEETLEARSRVENLKELVSSVTDYERSAASPTLEGFLDQVSLAADVDDLEDKTNRVTLMTLHNAKGLEFPVVFVTGMEEGLFPHNNSMQEDAEVQEERRLCYVGMTRAMDLLFLTGAASRTVYGAVQWRTPSRFLQEIPRELLNATGMAARVVATEGGLRDIVSDKPAGDDLRDPEWDEDGNEKPPYQLGDTVRHPRFGRGMVIALSGRGEDLKVTVSFPNFGKKQLVAKLAKLEKV